MTQGSLKIGFVPLCDSAPLIVAKERGFFAEQGLAVELSVEPSWSNIRDKLAVGLLDAAQMLAPMVISCTLGLGNMRVPLTTALALSRGGNAITVGQSILSRLEEGEALDAGLRRLINQARERGDQPLTFAVVYPFSNHHYELRMWLETLGIDADREIRLAVVPPQQMVEHLSAGKIAGYCVGAPWNGLAEKLGLGRTVVTGRALWDGRIEKVLAVRQGWVVEKPELHLALVRALLAACRWLDCRENRSEVADILAESGYLNAPTDVIRCALECPDLLVFHNDHANFPWQSQGLLLLELMRRCGQLPSGLDWRQVVKTVFDAETYRQAASALSIDFPGTDDRIEGGGRFDSQKIPTGLIKN